MGHIYVYRVTLHSLEISSVVVYLECLDKKSTLNKCQNSFE